MASEKISADETDAHRNICVLFTVIVGSLLVISLLAVILAVCLGQANAALFVSLSVADGCLIGSLFRLYWQYHKLTRPGGKG